MSDAERVAIALRETAATLRAEIARERGRSWFLRNRELVGYKTRQLEEVLGALRCKTGAVWIS